MNKSKWEINPTEDFDTEFEKILSFLTRELHKKKNNIWIKYIGKKEWNASWLHENTKNTVIINFAV